MDYLTIIWLSSVWVLLGFIGNFIAGWAADYDMLGRHSVTANWFYLWVWLGGPCNLIAALLFALSCWVGRKRKGHHPAYDYLGERVLWKWGKEPNTRRAF